MGTQKVRHQPVVVGEDEVEGAGGVNLHFL